MHMETDGLEFIEFAATEPRLLTAVFEQLGFTLIALHRSKDVLLYRQGNVNFVVNSEPNSFGQAFARIHGPSVCAFAVRVKDASVAYRQALGRGAKSFSNPVGPMQLNIPAIKERLNKSFGLWS
jgi:4-hydroxyphenylpyruvate dioxygenase